MNTSSWNCLEPAKDCGASWKLTDKKDPAALRQLQEVYESMWQELTLHMHKEEMVLFPVIERYEAALESGSSLPPVPFGSIANPIGVMEAEHDSADLALRRIRELTDGYEMPALRVRHIRRDVGRPEIHRNRSAYAYSSGEPHPVSTRYRARSEFFRPEQLK